MIRTLTGEVVYSFEEGVVVEVGGVGYEVLAGSNTASQVIGKKAMRLHVYTHVREEALQLFGFLTIDERQLFIQLLAVSGVGPKSALHVVDRGVSAVQAAIRGSDVAFFQSIPRLGKKTAQKIIVELQPKLGAESAFELTPLGSVKHDVKEALLSLGYDERSIQAVLGEVEESSGLETAIKKALKDLGRKR